MPATTAGGWPYQIPADHPKEYPAQSQTLANKLDAEEKTWVTTNAGYQMTLVGDSFNGVSNASGMMQIMFGVTFTIYPLVLISPGSFTGLATGSTPIVRYDGGFAPTTTYFWVANLAPTITTRINWMAVGRLP